MKWVSVLGFLCIFYLISCVIAGFIVGGASFCDGKNLWHDYGDNHDVMPKIWEGAPFVLVRSATIFAFAFYNQVQFVSCISDLHRPTTRRVRGVIIISTVVSLTGTSSP